MNKRFKILRSIKFQENTTIDINKEVVLEADSWKEFGEKVMEVWDNQIVPISNAIINALKKEGFHQFEFWDAVSYGDPNKSKSDGSSFISEVWKWGR